MRATAQRRAIRAGVETMEARVMPRAFAVGDLFIALSDSVAWWDSSGQSVGQLSTGSGANTGMAFDADGQLYVSRFTAGQVIRFSNTGQPLGAIGTDSQGANPLATPGTQEPEPIAFDASGRFYVGTADDRKEIYLFDASGKLVDTYDVPTEVRGSDWIALGADQHTLYYTSLGRSVLRYDLATKQALPPLVTNLPDERAYGLALLPDGGLIVSNRASIVRVDSSGAIQQTYDLPANDNWFSVSLSADGKSFWSADERTGTVAEFDIASGQAETVYEFHERVFGLAVYGAQFVATSSDLQVTAIDAPTQATVGDSLTYRLQVANTGPSPASGVVLTGNLPAGLKLTGATLPGGGQATASDGRLTLPLGSLGVGDSAELTLEFQATAAGDQVLPLTLSSRSSDADPADNAITTHVAVVAAPVNAGAGSGGSLAPIPVQVASLRRLGVHAQPTRVVLAFSGGLSAGTARDLSLYRLVAWTKVGKRIRTSPVKIASVSYDASSATVTIRTRQPLSMTQNYRIVVADGLKSAQGLALDGDADGVAGGYYTASFRGKQMIDGVTGKVKK